MGENRYAEIRAELTSRLASLERRVERIGGDRRHETVALEKDWEEQATQRENDEVLDALDEAGRQELAEIRTALARIDGGTYGRCAGCDEPIPPGRLQAIPTAAHCVACAEKRTPS